MKSIRPLLGAAVLCAFSVAYASKAEAPQANPQAPQDRSATPQTRPAPGGQQGGNTARPSRPDNGRPNPGGSNNGGPQVQPVRPNPGGPPPRPNPGGQPPSRPNPGGGNTRPPRPNPGTRPPRPVRPPQWGNRPPKRPSYNFRPNDRSYLHRYYLARLARINRARRIHIVIGGFFPWSNIPYISPLPPDIYGYLPPPPPGYRMGYYEGYVVVYDPVTYFVVNVIDLLQ